MAFNEHAMQTNMLALAHARIAVALLAGTVAGFLGAHLSMRIYIIDILITNTKLCVRWKHGQRYKRLPYF